MIATFLIASVGDINKKINTNKEFYENVIKTKKNINTNIKNLAEKIIQEEDSYKKITKNIRRANKKLILNKLRLSNSIKKIKELKKQSEILKQEKEKIELSVVEFVIERYSMSMGIKQANKESLKDIIDKEVYSLVFENSKQEVLDLNIDYLKVNRSIRKNQETTTVLNNFIKKQKEIRLQYIKMKDKQQKVILSLKHKHKLYQKNLVKVVSKQNKITELLGSLNILKKEEIKKKKLKIKKAREELLKKKREKIKKAKKELLKKKREKSKKQKKIKVKKEIKKDKKIKIANTKELSIKVRNIGSSAKGIKISKYYGAKTIAPLKSYKIVKKFGKYYDKVYKMELFNESVSLKTKKQNAKVLSVFAGKVVYAKHNAGILENVVIVKHKGSLHTIYSHLDEISPTLKAGKWIPKGYVVGRINDTLLFQATKNNKYIDPVKLFK